MNKKARAKNKNWFELVLIKLENLKKAKVDKKKLEKTDKEIVSLFKEEMEYINEESFGILNKIEVLERYQGLKEETKDLSGFIKLLNKEINSLEEEIKQQVMKEHGKKTKKIIRSIQWLLLISWLIVFILLVFIAATFWIIVAICSLVAIAYGFFKIRMKIASWFYDKNHEYIILYYDFLIKLDKEEEILREEDNKKNLNNVEKSTGLQKKINNTEESDGLKKETNNKEESTGLQKKR